MYLLTFREPTNKYPGFQFSISQLGAQYTTKLYTAHSEKLSRGLEMQLPQNQAFQSGFCLTASARQKLCKVVS